ncbi:MAG: tRNA (guanine(46)-N(7))-methyltransferase TrmB [Rhizobiaceae bacterium]|nr:tRNA (guanine(46)-N(7))-methyltransferase TrmB [Rhizobiaceae bacterium]
MNAQKNNNPGHPQRAAGAFFGRRIAKPLKRSQVKLFEELLPRLKLDLSNPAPADLRQLFTHKTDEIILEIGFGGGEHLVQRAVEKPASGYIGCEPFINGMGKILSAIDKNNLTNICLHDEDATPLLDWLPTASIDRVVLLYPDPWPKKRHWKRRFVNRNNLTQIARILKPGSEFHFASDIEHYVNWTLKHCRDSGLFDWQAQNSSDWKTPWALWQSTRYEKKALREDRVPAYLTFKRM